MSEPRLPYYFNEKIQAFIERCQKCDECVGLLDERAKPLFVEYYRPAPILFILEAPNYRDTYRRGYMTFGEDSDPTGRLVRILFEEELGLNVGLCITNSVLCLPRKSQGKHPVTREQAGNCLPFLKEQIELINPRIVCPLGGRALRALALIKEHGLRRLSEAVARPVKWYGRILFPLYHTGQLGRVSRPEEKQREDWRKLREIFSK